jgi:hypothetical protein
MRREYEVKWYEFNLTEPKSRKFFTEFGAILFKSWIELTQGAIAKIYRYE